MMSLNVPMKVAKDAELPNGRAFASWMGGGATEVQVACPGDDPAGLAQVEALVKQAEKLAATSSARAPALPSLPDELVLDHASGAGPALTALFGVADLTDDPVRLDLTRQNFAVMGPPMSGKSTVLQTIAHGLRASSGDDLALYAIGAASSPLAALDVWTQAGFSRATHAQVAEALWEAVADDESVTARAVLFVDAAEDVEDYDVERPLEALVKRECVRLVVACETNTLAKAYSGWLSTLRRNRSALMLQPESRLDVETALDVRPALRPGQTFPPGRGVFVANRGWSLVQTGR
jgi:hypothetical protein